MYGEAIFFFLQNEGKIYLNSNRCWVTKRHAIGGFFQQDQRASRNKRENVYIFISTFKIGRSWGNAAHFSGGCVPFLEAGREALYIYMGER